MKKIFSEHIEDGLTFLGDGIHRAVMEAKDHELETIKLGLISDDEKLRMLKRDLYEAARVGNADRVAVLRTAIATISNQLEAERKHRNSPVEFTIGICNSIILLAILATFISFPATWVCGKNQSQACQVSRVIPSVISKFFSEPK